MPACALDPAVLDDQDRPADTAALRVDPELPLSDVPDDRDLKNTCSETQLHTRSTHAHKHTQTPARAAARAANIGMAAGGAGAASEGESNRKNVQGGQQ